MARLSPRRPDPPAPDIADAGVRAPAPGRPLVLRFRDALRGVREAYLEEPNLRFHCFAAAGVLVLASALGVTHSQALYLLGTVTLVMVAELANTAVERAVDLAAEGRSHPLARQAKDVAAGAVLVATLHATAAGWLIFVQPRGISGLLQELLAFPRLSPGLAAAVLTLWAAAGLGGLLAGRRRMG